MTVRRNLKNYNPGLGAVVPEKVWFYDRSSRVNRWDVILDIDQSGSMGQIHSVFFCDGLYFGVHDSG